METIDQVKILLSSENLLMELPNEMDIDKLHKTLTSIYSWNQVSKEELEEILYEDSDIAYYDGKYTIAIVADDD